MADEGYTAGYAEFWHANSIREMSDGRIDMYCFAAFNTPLEMGYMTSINQTYHWLQLVSHDTERPLEGKVCIVLSTDEYNCCLWKTQMEDYLIYSNDDYKIFGFESYEHMLSVIGSYSYAFNGEFLGSGYDEDGVRVLYPTGYQFGPYITFYEGRYRVTVEGSNIQYIAMDCTSFSGSNHFQYDEISHTDTGYVVEFTCDCDHYEGEVALYNTSDSECVTLTRVSIDHIS